MFMERRVDPLQILLGLKPFETLDVVKPPNTGHEANEDNILPNTN